VIDHNCAAVSDVDEGGDKVQRFKKWFWSIVEKMSPSERQDLVSKELCFFHTDNDNKFWLMHL